MANLTQDDGTSLLLDAPGGAPLTDDLPAVPAVPAAPVFPLMLALRLFIHAAWLLFMLIPG